MKEASIRIGKGVIGCVRVVLFSYSLVMYSFVVAIPFRVLVAISRPMPNIISKKMTNVEHHSIALDVYVLLRLLKIPV